MTTVDADATDVQILSLLQDDGRMSIVDLAKAVALSPTAVTRRIQRLEEQGVIRGYSARVDYGRLGWEMAAFVEVRFTGTTSADDMDRLATTLPEASAAYTTAGHQDVLMLVRATSVGHLRDVINRLRTTAGVIGTRTHVILEANENDGWRPPVEGD